MAGRTLKKYTRVYVDGYDMSGYSRMIGPLQWEFEEVDLTAPMGDSVKGYLPGHPTISPGTLNVVFDNTATSGAHAVLSSQNDDRVVLVAIGDRVSPPACARVCRLMGSPISPREMTSRPVRADLPGVPSQVRPPEAVRAIVILLG